MGEHARRARINSLELEPEPFVLKVNMNCNSSNCEERCQKKNSKPTIRSFDFGKAGIE